MNGRPSVRQRLTWRFVFLLLGLAAIGAGIFAFERCVSLPARTARLSVDELERVGRDARNAFIEMANLQPRVTINQRVYFEQTAEVAELAVISQRIEVEHDFLHTWAGSSKRLRLRGTFTAKAGFNLRQEIGVRVDPGEIVVSLPHAQILGIEQNAVDVLAFENGFWNPISGADVQSELATLTQLATEQARERDLPAEAEQKFRAQLTARLKTSLPVHVIFYDLNAPR